MRLSCQKVSLLVFASAIACHNATGPSTISAHFVLQSINGRPLPTYLAATPGPTATIISSSLTLDETGKAVIVEHRDDMFVGERTYTSTTSYTIRGLQIEIFAEPCLAYVGANCAENRVGKILNDRLNLIINPSSDFQIVYEYRAG